MIDIEVAGNSQAIALIKEPLASGSGQQVNQFTHKGAAGEAGVIGLVTSIVLPFLPNLVEILKIALPHDRNLKITVNGLELNVRDIGEAKEVIGLLQDRGLLTPDKK